MLRLPSFFVPPPRHRAPSFGSRVLRASARRAPAATADEVWRVRARGRGPWCELAGWEVGAGPWWEVPTIDHRRTTSLERDLSLGGVGYSTEAGSERATAEIDVTATRVVVVVVVVSPPARGV